MVPVAALEARDAHVGMALEQAHELAAGDAGGTDDAHADVGAAAGRGLAEVPGTGLSHGHLTIQEPVACPWLAMA